MNPYDHLYQIESFEIVPCGDFIDKHNLYGLVGDKCKIPDHSILFSTFRVHALSTTDSPEPTTESYVNNESSARIYNGRKFKVRSIPDTFLNDESSNLNLSQLIFEIEKCRNNQNDIDVTYEIMTNMISQEMENVLPNLFMVKVENTFGI